MLNNKKGFRLNNPNRKTKIQLDLTLFSKKSKKNNFKKGFTLVEFIIVMAIIGILVLMASPKFLNYVEKAKETQIKNDTKVVENILKAKMAENIANGNNKTLFNTDGKISNEIMDNINTKLDKDKFFYKKDDDIVVYNIEEEEEEEEIITEDKNIISSKNVELFIEKDTVNNNYIYNWRYNGDSGPNIDLKLRDSFNEKINITNIEEVKEWLKDDNEKLNNLLNGNHIESWNGIFHNIEIGTLDLSDLKIDKWEWDYYESLKNIFSENTKINKIIINTKHKNQIENLLNGDNEWKRFKDIIEYN